MLDVRRLTLDVRRLTLDVRRLTLDVPRSTPSATAPHDTDVSVAITSERSLTCV